MVGEVVFHLGDCKTGTTSIQRTFSAGGVRPASGGPSLYYPPGVNHIPLASSLTRTHEMPHADRRFERMSALLAQSRADIAVISAETFEFVDPEILARRIERHFKPWKGRIRFISYVRPHAERLVSGFAERTKQGNHLGSLEEFFETYLERGTFHYAPRVARWRAAFGAAHEVRPMLRSQLKDGDVVADFVDYVLRGAAAEIRLVPANESLTTADLAALRALHRGLAHHARGRIRDTRITFGWNLAGLLSDLPRPEGAEKPQLDRALAERVVQAYAADAAEMDRLYFEGTPLSDALAAAPGRARANRSRSRRRPSSIPPRCGCCRAPRPCWRGCSTTPRRCSARRCGPRRPTGPAVRSGRRSARPGRGTRTGQGTGQRTGHGAGHRMGRGMGRGASCRRRRAWRGASAGACRPGSGSGSARWPAACSAEPEASAGRPTCAAPVGME